MKTTILVENTPIKGSSLAAEDGFCAYIESDGISVLFDTGLSGIFLDNAEKMGLALRPDYLVLSHGHRDHTGGLSRIIAEPFKKPPVCITHPDTFWPKVKREEWFGCPATEEECASEMTLSLSDEPLWITEKILFLGEIPRRCPFEPVEAGREVVRDGKRERDNLRDDSAIACVTEEGLVIVSGCAHSGICNIISYAQEITGIRKVRAVIGGIHLGAASAERIEETARFLKECGAEELYLCHCTGRAALRAFEGRLPTRECGCGSVIEL